MITLTQYTIIKKRIISLTEQQKQDPKRKAHYTKRIRNLNTLISRGLNVSAD